MRDLLVCVPSRGRPDRLKVMLDAALSLSEAQTDVSVGIDRDDPSWWGYNDSVDARADDARGDSRVSLYSAVPWDRLTVSAWTNKLTAKGAGGYRAFCVMNDDHVPRTQGWDRLLLAAIDGLGGTGIAYGNDLLQGQNLPTHWVMSADLVDALGWLMPSFLRHYHTDDVVRDIGKLAGCLAYVPEVVIEHRHPGAGKGQWDETYSSEAARDHEDLAAYERWLVNGVDSDVAKVTALLAAKKATA